MNGNYHRWSLLFSPPYFEVLTLVHLIVSLNEIYIFILFIYFTYPSNEPPLLQLMSHHISYQGYHHISLILLFTYLYLVICFCSWLYRRVGQVFVCLCKLEIEWNIYIYSIWGGGTPVDLQKITLYW